tara:strand:+ start:3535 stop:4200 length:666 start_codon:yes stop_codon:yes gene_type:complete
MYKLFSNGCSFLTPRPKDGVETFVSNELANNYNAELINLAMGGRGNSRISFSTKVWFEQNKVDKVFAVIGWSSQHRNDYVTNDGWKAGRIEGTDLTWRTWKTLDNVTFIDSQRGWDIENNATITFLDHVFDLQNYFLRRDIPYVMYNALPNSLLNGSKDSHVIYNSLNLKRFFQPESSHYEYVLDKKLIVSPNDPHPSTEGHVQWANMLKEFIDANNLRTI